MLNDFAGYLSKKIGLKEKYVPHYVKWVDSCYKFFKRNKNKPLSGEQQRKFLKYLSETHEDWQIKQADTALRHYFYFLSSQKKRSYSHSPTQSIVIEEVEEKLRKAVRLRHLSYSTEKSYTLWARSFLSFLESKSPEDLTAKDVEDYLSHLAVEKKVSPSTQNQALNALVFLFRHALNKL